MSLNEKMQEATYDAVLITASSGKGAVGLFLIKNEQ